MAYIDLYKLANCEFHILYFKVQTCYLKRLSTKYVRSERGRSGQGKSTLARMDGMRESAVSVRAPIFLFLQVRYKVEIKKASYSDSQNYLFPTPLYN